MARHDMTRHEEMGDHSEHVSWGSTQPSVVRAETPVTVPWWLAVALVGAVIGGLISRI